MDAAQPLTLRPEIAGAIALVGLMAGLVAMGTGTLLPGVIGLTAMGLAMGLSGSLGNRATIAALLWLTTMGLSLLLIPYGQDALAVAGPAIFSLLFIAVGQCAGLLAGVLVWRPVSR